MPQYQLIWYPWRHQSHAREESEGGGGKSKDKLWKEQQTGCLEFQTHLGTCEYDSGRGMKQGNGHIVWGPACKSQKEFQGREESYLMHLSKMQQAKKKGSSTSVTGWSTHKSQG